MPPAQEILDGLTAIANGSRSEAIGWHVLLAMLLLKIVDRRRPSNQLVGMLLVLPLISVSILALAAGNPFNGVVFAVLAIALAALAFVMPAQPVTLAPPRLAVPGIVLVAFAWGYPHFLETDTWTEYLYAAPLGVVPCPTLSALVGVTLMLNLLESRAWAMVLSGAGMFYGAFGVLRLGVGIDVVLLAGAVFLAAVAVMVRPKPEPTVRLEPDTTAAKDHAATVSCSSEVSAARSR